MALFRRKIRQRRLEVRRNKPSSRGQLWQRFISAGGPGSIALALLFTIATVTLVISSARDRQFIRLGDIHPKQFARVDFESPNTQRTAQARELAAGKTAYTYKLDDTLIEQVRTRLTSLPSMLKGYPEDEQLPQALAEQFALNSPEQVSLFVPYATDELKNEWDEAVSSIASALSDLVILSPEQYEQEQLHLAVEFKLSTGNMVVAANKNDRSICSLNQSREIAQLIEGIETSLPVDIQQKISHYLKTLILSGRPTYVFDRTKSTQDVENARNDVSIQYDQYAENDLIFQGGRVGESDLTILHSEQAAWQTHMAATDPGYMRRIYFGSGMTTVLIIFGLCAYISMYRPRIVRKHMRGVAILCLMLMMLSAVRLLSDSAGWNYHMAVGAAVLVAMILTVAYDQRFGLAAGGGFALLMNVMLDGGTGLLVSMMIPCGVGVILIKEIRTRSLLVKAGAIAAGAAFVAVSMTQMASGTPVNGPLLTDCSWAAGSVLAVGFLIQGILPLVERLFHIATAMTLLEWCDANKKLLKRLAMEAPGTFNHSLMLGTLCEAAAESIGSNGLLARVGAYYHDIGKINKPRYFVENQFGSPSMHDKLSPAMSLLVITGHVKDGIEMAKEYGLPNVLHQFIATHHGTTLVKYFYHAAAKQSNEEGRPTPNDTEFRYPGPKPQSAEAAILMLADATESSVRAMSDPTPARIEAQANSVLNDRLTDGQLDECELTLRDVHKIEQSLVKSLCGIYHGRIAYPKEEIPKNSNQKAAPQAAPASN